MIIKLFSLLTNNNYTNNGIEYLTSYLRKNFPKDRIESFFYNNKNKYDIYEEIKKPVDIIGFSVFSTNYNFFKEVVYKVKKNNVNVITVFGGHFITLNYNDIIVDCSPIDYLVLGDGETPLKKIINRHKSSSELLEDIHTITSSTSLGKKVNIEKDIDREHSYDYYIQNMGNNRYKTHSLFTKSNVCAGSCSFCCSRKGKIIYRDINKIYTEIMYVYKNFNIKDFWITDDDIFDADNDHNRIRLTEFFNRIRYSNLKLGFSAFSKSKSICNIKNHSLLNVMSKSGVHHIFLGIDGGNKEDISLYHKLSTVNQGIEAINLLRTYNIGVRFGLIFLNPYSTLKRLEETYQFLIKVRSANYFHYGGLRVQLLNGTKLFDKVKNDKLLNEDFSLLNNNDSYKFVHPEIGKIVDVLSLIIPQLNNIKYQFNVFKYKYEQALHMANIPSKYSEIYKKYENIEFTNLKEFFGKLYVHHDFDYCYSHIDKFVEAVKGREEIYKPLIHNLLSEIYGE